MFPPSTYTRAWADEKRRELGNCDPVLLEKCVHALTLLGFLAESGLPFIFKGGTSLLLHLPQISRLSIDIDIVSPATDDELDRVVQKIGSMDPFSGMEESHRNQSSEREALPRRRHFKFFFRSDRAKDGEAAVLLDVVQEKECPHVTVQRPISTSFLVPEREIAVTLTTIESLLGDKLTAFAPTTTGVRCAGATEVRETSCRSPSNFSTSACSLPMPQTSQRSPASMMESKRKNPAIGATRTAARKPSPTR